MPEHPKDETQDDGRTDEERARDKALKATFPASDPISAGSGTASPSGDPDQREEADLDEGS